MGTHRVWLTREEAEFIDLIRACGEQAAHEALQQETTPTQPALESKV